MATTELNQSLYYQYISNAFPQLVLRTVERLNEKNQTALTYMFRQMLRKQFSIDGRWATLTGNYNRVAADVVAMDSSLPLKMRDTLERVSGDIPKMGMELWLNETQMSQIDAMIAQNIPYNQIIAKILEDTPRVIEGIYERLELMFLRGLSTGIALVPNTENVGTGVRVDYGYLPENQFGVNVIWGSNTSVVIDDINRVKTKAINDGNALLRAYGDTTAFDNLIKSDQFKEQFAFNKGFVGSNIPTPTLEQANTVFSSLFGFTFTKIDRVVKTEKNGDRNTVTPWKQGTIVFTADEVVGDLVWTNLAETNRMVKGNASPRRANYQLADDYILVSKYHTIKPSFAEFTTSQARVVPIVTNVDRIYTLDTTIIQG